MTPRHRQRRPPRGIHTPLFGRHRRRRTVRCSVLDRPGLPTHLLRQPGRGARRHADHQSEHDLAEAVPRPDARGPVRHVRRPGSDRFRAATSHTSLRLRTRKPRLNTGPMRWCRARDERGFASPNWRANPSRSGQRCAAASSRPSLANTGARPSRRSAMNAQGSSSDGKCPPRPAARHRTMLRKPVPRVHAQVRVERLLALEVDVGQGGAGTRESVERHVVQDPIARDCL